MVESQNCKRILGLGKETLGAIVTNDVRKAKVFKKYGLDYGNDGKKTLSNACKEKHLVVAQVENDLQAVEKKVSTKILPCNDWELNFLSDYIVNVHHHYVRTYLPKMQEYAQKVMKVHADRHPELYEINDLITAVGSNMLAHMEKEELRLFPLIKTLVSRSKEISAEKPISSKDFQNFIVMHEAEHASVGHEMKQIRILTQNYTLPEDACASYIFLYMMMEEFEDDLQMHIHLENNILFPKALVLEDKLN